MVTVDVETMHFDTAVEFCLNGGKDKMAAQSGFKMFQGHKGKLQSSVGWN